jgi:hypothetical protein
MAKIHIKPFCHDSLIMTKRYASQAFLGMYVFTKGFYLSKY